MNSSNKHVRNVMAWIFHFNYYNFENGGYFQKHDSYGRTLTKIFNKRKQWFLALLLVITICFCVRKKRTSYVEFPSEPFPIIPKIYDGSWRKLTDDQKNKLSVLGRILYLEEKRPPQRTKQFKILFWKYGKYIENRHLKQFGDKNVDPFQDCAVSNCKISLDDEDITNADLVIFHLHRIKNVDDLPKRNTKKGQIWAFLTDESPYNTFLQSKNSISDFDGKFNWSMTYRMDSDIPVPYGRTRKILGNFPIENLIPPNKRRDKLITILGSNCGGKNHRWQYVKQLKKHIDVDVYGGCGNKTACPGHFKSDCPAIDDYLFYLSFENSDCKEYITEKVFWNAYHKNSIPIVMGYDRKTYEKLLPPGSFLHVDDFATPRDLAVYILSLNETNNNNNNDSGFEKFFEWKRNYEVVNEHGYFKSKSYHFCRACEALNYNTMNYMKVYSNISEFWNKSKDCSVR